MNKRFFNPKAMRSLLRGAMTFGGLVLTAALFFAACQNPTEEEKEYTVTVTGGATGGRVIPVPEKAKEGAKVILVAAPAVYYTLAEAPLVSANNNQLELSGDGQAEPYSFIMPAANVTVQPSFVINSSYNTLPIYISDDLALIGHDEDYPLNGVYQLQNDIALPDEWAPIGDGERVFSGIFDGNGKTITVNSYLHENEDGPLEYTGVFGYAVAATIKNLTLNLDQVEVRPQGAYFGFLVAYATFSELQDIAVTGGEFEINLDNIIQYSVGAIAGVLDRSQLRHGSLNGDLTVSRRNAETDPEASFFNNIGGMIGLATGSSISDCAVTGDVSIASLFMMAGGIAGNVEKSVMTGNSMVGNLSGISVNDFAEYGTNSNIRIGGLAGSFANGGIADSVFEGNLLADLSGTATRNMNGYTEVGGAIGYIIEEASVDSLAVKGRIEFKIAGPMTSRYCLIGGIAGRSEAQVQNSSFEGDINVVDNLTRAANASHYISAGGVIGLSSSGSAIKGCYASGVIAVTNKDDSGSSIGAITRTYTGGIAGNSASTKINSCYYTGSITNDGVYSYAGGIVGYNTAGTAADTENKITQCYALLGDVLANGSGTKPAANPENATNAPLRIAAGGIVGRMYITSNLDQYNDRNVVEYSAALFASGHPGSIKAEGDEAAIFAGTIVGNRNTASSGSTIHPGGILTANISNIPTTAITPYVIDISVEDESAGKNGVYATMTQESFFGSRENGNLGWDAGVWTWDSGRELPKLLWQQD
jgi:hypothetical protein